MDQMSELMPRIAVKEANGNLVDKELEIARELLADSDEIIEAAKNINKKIQVEKSIEKILGNITTDKTSSEDIITDLLLLSELGDTLERVDSKKIVEFLDTSILDHQLMDKLVIQIKATVDEDTQSKLTAIVLGTLSKSAIRNPYNKGAVNKLIEDNQALVVSSADHIDSLEPIAALNLRQAVMYQLKFQEGYPDDQKWALNLAEKIFMGPWIKDIDLYFEKISLLTYAIFRDRWSPICEEGTRVVAHMMETQFNLPTSTFEQIAEQWGYAHNQDNIETIISRNLVEMFSMEELRPGIIKYLLDRCGIANVARYPKQVLTDQFDDWKRVTETRKNGLPVSNSKYTLLTYPYKDNDMQNGGVFYLDAGKLANLHQQLKQQGSRLRVSEIGFIRGKKSRRTLRTLLSMVRDFGPCDVFIAGAHGDKKGMNYHQGLAGRFGILDLLIAARHRHKIVKDGGQIVLSSCLTGADGGLAEAMAKEFGVRVDAPEEATVEKKWHLASEKVNGEKRLRLWPVYRDGRRRTWKPKKP